VTVALPGGVPRRRARGRIGSRGPRRLAGTQPPDGDLVFRLRKQTRQRRVEAPASTLDESRGIMSRDAEHVSHPRLPEAAREIHEQAVALAPQFMLLAHEGYVPRDIRPRTVLLR
jgi:hypothetical protein